MKHSSIIRLLVVGVGFGLLGCATTQAPAQTPAATTPAPAQTSATTPAATTPAPVKKTYKGSEGVRELLAALQNGDGGTQAVDVEIVATPQEILNGSLDSLLDTDMYEGPARALMMAMGAGAQMAGDSKAAVAATIVTTYNGWVVTASGISQQRIPEWTEVVMSRVTKSDQTGANEATKLQIASETRVDRLVNPGWIDSFAWWWSR